MSDYQLFNHKEQRTIRLAARLLIDACGRVERRAQHAEAQYAATLWGTNRSYLEGVLRQLETQWKHTAQPSETREESHE